MNDVSSNINSFNSKYQISEDNSFTLACPNCGLEANKPENSYVQSPFVLNNDSIWKDERVLEDIEIIENNNGFFRFTIKKNINFVVNNYIKITGIIIDGIDSIASVSSLGYLINAVSHTDTHTQISVSYSEFSSPTGITLTSVFTLGTDPKISIRAWKLSFDKYDSWFNSSRVITFESFNNSPGFYPISWYTDPNANSDLIENEYIKYKVIHIDDFSPEDYTETGNIITIDLQKMKEKFNSKSWLNLKGKELNNDLDGEYNTIEESIQKRSFEVDKNSNSKFSGSDGSDSDIGCGWINYEATIPKCLAFQILFGINSNNVSVSPSIGHVVGWYIRNINVYKRL